MKYGFSKIPLLHYLAFRILACVIVHQFPHIRNVDKSTGLRIRPVRISLPFC